MGSKNDKLPTRPRGRDRKPRKSFYENAELKNGILSEINQLRKLHQVPELISSPDIDSISQAFANKIAKKGDLEYSNNTYKGSELGEILFYNQLGEVDTDSVIDEWYQYHKDFRYNQKNQEESPFSQLVWKKSKLIGIGFARDENGGTYIVANFFPAGNVTDQYSFNVFPPKGERKKKDSVISVFSQFELEALEAHNKYRTKHHVPPLNLNKELCKIAQSYAEKLLQNNSMDYSFGKFKGNDMGENIFKCQGTEATGEMATNDWYNEVKSHNFKKDFQKNTGHFTQIIWKDTKEVGFGKASRGNTYYVVANYYPPGNFLGQYQDNVLKA
jgi:uncharacterized protein YkwD